METGIFIRTFVDGKWGNFDIGDKLLPDYEIVKWLREHNLNGGFGERLILILLGRYNPVIEP